MEKSLKSCVKKSKLVAVRVLLYRGKGVVSSLIQWQTRSKYSHAAILVDGLVYDSREFKGIRKPRTPNKEDMSADVFTVWVTERQKVEIVHFLEKQVGKKYDYTMVARFVSRRKESRRSSNKWFCSELVFAAFEKAKIKLLERIEAWAVSPGLLSLSPLLHKEE